MLKKLNSLLDFNDKRFLFMLFLFSIFISLVETIGISAIMPFMSIAMDFEKIHTNEYYSFVYNFLSFSSEINFVIVFGVVLILFYILRSLINLSYYYLLSKFTQSRYSIFAHRLLKNYLGLPYKVFTGKNSSTMTKSIVTEANNLTILMSAVIFLISELLIVVFIYIMMLYTDYKITLLLTMFLLINALLMMKTVTNKIKTAGIIRSDAQKEFYEIINRSLGNFKIIKLQSNDKEVLDDFNKNCLNYANANIVNSTLNHVPRLFLEAVGFSIVILIVIYLIIKYENNIFESVSLLSMFILAMYRLLPSVTRIFKNYNSIVFFYKSLDIVHTDLMNIGEHLGEQEIKFDKNIILKNVSFEYEENKPILQDINLTIEKGSSSAFVGDSGSGKSTLVDIIIGLYKPKEGKVLVGDTEISDQNVKSWRLKVGYIPQSVYLFDGTVGENVVFGSKYDKEKVDRVLKKAKIYDFLNTKEGQNTFVGEGGIMLSGGQKQRIAIARALYTDPEILILDEATSALDTETEKEIMNEIYDISKDKTLIIIAHRLSTIKQCEHVYKIINGKIVIEK